MPLPFAALALALSPQRLSAPRLSAVDLTLVALYLIGITLFGLHFREKKGAPKAAGATQSDRSLKSYFLANNTIPWWAIALSIVSAETSTLTIISIPGIAFAGDFGFLQVVIGYMLGRLVVAALFLPRYFAGEMLTAYQLIDRRFGPILHKVTAGLFLLTRAAAEGVRVFAVSIVVGIAIGTRDILSIAIISTLTLLYTFEGGMAAVIWTDVVQMAIYIGGTFVAIATLGTHVTGGWTTIHHVASAAGKFHMLNFAFNLTQSYTFWAGVLGGTFLTMASHGTDQLMVQRMLAARSLRESQLALLSSGVIIFIQFALFLLIGAGLYVFYGQHPTSFASSDRIFPTFIVREMPIGIAGLLVAAILAAAMSNLSAALNSLSSTTVVDFYMHLRPQADDRERNLISKSSTILWAFVLFAIAVYSIQAGGKGHVVEIGLSIASVAYGCLLGVFLLGTLTRFATQTGATIGMIFGFALNLWLWQGAFPMHLGPLTIPHIAWTWYVLIGALATFAIGSVASLLFSKQSTRARTITASLFLLFLLSFPQGICFSSAQAQTTAPITNRHSEALALGLITREEVGLQPPGYVLAQSGTPAPAPDFTPITTLLNDAIAAHKLPGAVVLIGHAGHIVFEQAYGDRKLANEPGLDGKPSPAEPMTEDTIFDMASLTKDLATAPAIMQLYESGKITSFDDTVEKYLPAFNPTHNPIRSKVTLRMLLTHTSGEAPDVDLKDPWGLTTPDKAEGLHRALTTSLKDAPGSVFTYSDINFILLGDLIETLSGQTEDIYARDHIFLPLGMTDTAYHSLDHICKYSYRRIGAAAVPDENHADLDLIGANIPKLCAGSVWNIESDWRTAPTAHDNEGTPATNPDFDHLLRGTVHDPTTRRMGGVAGHAGVFSTAHDVALYAQALLDKLTKNTGPFPLKQSTLRLMTTPEQPSTVHPATILTLNPALPMPTLMTTQGIPVRGFGWDINSPYSRPRGAIFPTAAPSQPSSPTPSFGHTGYTGTSLWIDPASDTYVILLSNAIHPRGNAPISTLRGEIATAAAQALHLYEQPVIPGGPSFAPSAKGGVSSEGRPSSSNPSTVRYPEAGSPRLQPGVSSALITPQEKGLVAQGFSPGSPLGSALPNSGKTLTGIDVLEQTHFADLQKLAEHHQGPFNFGLLTNQTGLDSQGNRTIDVLSHASFLLERNIHLTTLFSPEHGITGKLDQSTINAETDPATRLPVISLYSPKDSDKRPSHDQLKDLDAVVIDLQDAGVHFWTYESVLGYFLEAASTEKTQYHHTLDILILDRPNPIGGLAVQGPVVDPDKTSYVAYMPLPVRHGLTFGELARYIVATKHLNTPLTVIPMQHWQRSEFFTDTGLPWINPSPNLRSPEAAILYPALGLIETTNISVGRGTDHPFSFFGAGAPPTKSGAPSSEPATKAWFNAQTVADALTARHIPGVTFTPTTEPIAEDANHYPFHGQTIEAVHVTCTDPTILDTPELGIEILAVLHRLYPTQFHLKKAMPLLANRATLDALIRGDAPRTIAATWQPALTAFRAASKPYLLY